MELSQVMDFITQHADSVSQYVLNNEEAIIKYVNAFELQNRIDALQSQVDSLPHIQEELAELKAIKIKPTPVDPINP